nr:leaf specific thionin [Hordeum vulgare subsp. vulgare]
KSCCKDTLARNCYNTCRFAGGSRPVCAGACRCKIISGPKCPSDYPK